MTATLIGLELDDVALAVARDGELLSQAPSVVDRASGAAAIERVRREPQSVSLRHWSDLVAGAPLSHGWAAIARAELAARTTGVGFADATVQVALPARFDNAATGRLLAVLRGLGWSVADFVDSGTLAVAALALDAPCAVVDIGQQHVSVSRVDGGARPVRRSSLTRTRMGLAGVTEAWLRLVSEAMVMRTRFDPLHDAVSEQRLYEALLPAAARAAADGSVEVEIESPAGPRAVTLARDQFAERAEPLYRDLIDMLHAQRPAGRPLTIVLPEIASRLPGLRERLEDFTGCAVLTRAPGLAARAASRVPLAETPAEDGAGVRLLRSVLRARLLAAGGAEQPLEGAVLAGARRRAAPTHALLDGRAVALAAGRTLEIGREPGPNGLRLADGLAGVSRLHCSLRAEEGGVTLIDHSRHGTWLNGERVAGRARAAAGDRLRIGDPGIEIALIALG